MFDKFDEISVGQLPKLDTKMRNLAQDLAIKQRETHARIDSTQVGIEEKVGDIEQKIEQTVGGIEHKIDQLEKQHADFQQEIRGILKEILGASQTSRFERTGDEEQRHLQATTEDGL